MPTAPITLRVALTTQAPPTEFRIFPFGPLRTSKGTFLFDRKAARAVLAAWKEHGSELSMDYEHAALQDASEIARGAPAAAWFKLELRSDGLWAVNVRWTPRALQYLKAKEYRYFSPAFTIDENRRITRLVNIALTNLPATKGLAPLVAAKDQPMKDDLLKALTEHREAMESHAEEMKACRQDIAQHRQEMLTHADQLKQLSAPAEEDEEVPAEEEPVEGEEAGDDKPTALRQVIQLTGARSTSEAIGRVRAMKDAHTKVVELTQRLAEVEQRELERDVQALVQAALDKGQIMPAEKPAMLAMGRKDLAMLKGYLEVKPVLASIVQPRQQRETGKPVILSEDERQGMIKMGFTDEQEYLKLLGQT